MNRFEYNRYSRFMSSRTRAEFFSVFGDLIGEDRQRRRCSPAPLQQRAALAREVHRLAEHGYVAMVHGGMDCDGSAWNDRVRLLRAIPVAVEREVNDFYANAEGPQWHHLAAPSTVENLEPECRDLALEAFENDHPHILHY